MDVCVFKLVQHIPVLLILLILVHKELLFVRKILNNLNFSEIVVQSLMLNIFLFLLISYFYLSQAFRYFSACFENNLMFRRWNQITGSYTCFGSLGQIARRLIVRYILAYSNNFLKPELIRFLAWFNFLQIHLNLKIN